MKPSTQSPHETSFHGDEFLTTYNELVEKIGPPTHLRSGDGKVRYSWTMETENGNVFTIYDWKEPFLEHEQEIYWHIGAHTPQASRQNTYSLQDLYRISKAFNVAFKLVPESSEFPTEICSA